MDIDSSLIPYIARTYYNFTLIGDKIVPLCGYSDRNYLLSDGKDKKDYVLKIVNEEESDQAVVDIIDEILESIHEYTSNDDTIEFVAPKLIRTTANNSSAWVDIRRELEDGNSKIIRHNLKLVEFFPGITIMEFANLHPKSYLPDQLYEKLGRLCSQLFCFLRNKRHLQERLKEARGDTFAWQLMTSDKRVEKLAKEVYPNGNLLIERVLKEFNGIRARLDKLPEFILHGDLSTKNILINLSGVSRFCIIDFQDIQLGPQVVDLAILMLYNILEHEHIDFRYGLKLIPRWTLRGYQSNNRHPINIEELNLIPTLMKLRLCQSLLNGQLANQTDPKNAEYTMGTSRRGWQLLELLVNDPLLSDSNKMAEFWSDYEFEQPIESEKWIYDLSTEGFNSANLQ